MGEAEGESRVGDAGNVTLDVTVGDAPPVMFATGTEPGDPAVPDADATALENSGAEETTGEGRTVPFGSVGLVLGALAAVALLAARRR